MPILYPQDISEVEQKWSENGGPHVDNRKSNNNTPETLIDQYQHSIAQIQEMQNDIQRLTQQQNTYHHHQPQPPSHQQPVTLHSFATSAAAQQPITMNYYQSPQPVYQPILSCDIVHQPQIQWNPMYQGSPLPISYTPSPPPPAHMIPQHVVHGGASPSDIATNQNYFDQQHEAVDRLIRSSDPNQVHGGESGERFYLHDQNQQTSRKNWSAPPVHFNNSHIHNSEQDSRNVWNTR
ncbi:patronin-like [Diaphorina citri]|uniref:Patronin-like n=1 Tax=Diaphorina citri TaxID=121845 RepID=A0A1S4EKC5_DIACI|nr:patronin-like [Diaphorina citri]